VTGALIEALQCLDCRVDAIGRDQPAANGDGSQAGEVTELRGLIRPGFPESIVDVGAYDGVSLSNSRPFVLAGWRGVLIEPHPTHFARLQENSASLPNVECLRCACSDEAGVLPLFIGTDGADTMMSTLSRDDNAWFKRTRSAESVDVAVEPVEAILDRVEFPRDFGILLVDTEGMDYEVLRGVAFERHSPRIILTEEYILNPDKHKRNTCTCWTADTRSTRWSGATPSGCGTTICAPSSPADLRRSARPERGFELGFMPSGLW
jgi:FkbM family methyltransferase